MTDNDIIKAFNDALVFEGMNIYLCNIKTKKMIVLPLKNVVDVIKRQKAEIEKLNKLCEEQNEEIKRVHELTINNIFLMEDIALIKAEAVKEFAESINKKVENAREKYQRLCKEQGEKEDEAMNIHFRGVIKIVNNLLKETVGDADG